MISTKPIPLVYALHCGNLYGTERMALETVQGLGSHFESTIFAPPGRVIEEASSLGFKTSTFSSRLEFSMKLRPYLSGNQRLAFVATGVVHSLACIGWNKLYRRDVTHLHIVHGGAGESLSYARKRRLNRSSVTFVAVSGFVKERLIANGVDAGKITVIENFLTDDRAAAFPARKRFELDGIKSAVVVSRVDPIKRIDLLLDALDQNPELKGLTIKVLGTGWALEALRARAERSNPNVHFEGFSEDVSAELGASDLLLHLCPVEPFGLAVLEAMAAGVPVLVPDAGGAGSLVEEGVSGFRFQANNAEALAAKIKELMRAPAAVLNKAAEGGRRALSSRFSSADRIADYARLLGGQSI